MGTSKLVMKAQKASSVDISSAADIPETLNLKDREFLSVRVLHASDLSVREREDVWNLFEANMRAVTEPSSFGWNPQEKKEELFHRDSRFILILHDRVPGETETEANSESRSELAAYSMFRFDYDEGEELLYCYEMQVASSFRNRGLGHFLMDRLMRIGKHWKMEKVMLTVLKENTSARRFYANFGFEMDPISPDYVNSSGSDEDEDEKEEWDYEILFKIL